MIIHVTGGADLPALGRALDLVLQLFVDEHITHVQGLSISAELFSAAGKVELASVGGLPYPMFIERRDGTDDWEALRLKEIWVLGAPPAVQSHVVLSRYHDSTFDDVTARGKL